jgi:hypothetical protein
MARYRTPEDFAALNRVAPPRHRGNVERYGAKVYWKREHRSEIVRLGVGLHERCIQPAYGTYSQSSSVDMRGAHINLNEFQITPKEPPMYASSLSLDRRARTACAAALFLASLSPCLAFADSPSSPFPGLEPVPSKSVGALYRRPDLDISAYNKITIGEPVVEFSKNWNPRNYGTFGISAAQLTKIRVELADMAKSVFAKTLSDGGYEIVTDAGDGVLVITTNIVDVFINAPDVPKAGLSRSYTMDAGSMTLVLQVNDAVTGTLLSVALDKRRSGASTMQWATSVSNRAAAERMLKGWAEQLKRELDAVRSK